MIGETQVVHEAQQHRFVLPVAGSLAVLEYRCSGNRVDFHHTFVPPEARGGGHARRLVAAGLEWARGNGMEIHASCWYVADYLALESRRGS